MDAVTCRLDALQGRPHPLLGCPHSAADPCWGYKGLATSAFCRTTLEAVGAPRAPWGDGLRWPASQMPSPCVGTRLTPLLYTGVVPMALPRDILHVNFIPEPVSWETHLWHHQPSPLQLEKDPYSWSGKMRPSAPT